MTTTQDSTTRQTLSDSELIAALTEQQALVQLKRAEYVAATIKLQALIAVAREAA